MNDRYGVELVNTFWKLTYLDGEIEYTDYAPYSKNSYYEYERLERVGNPVVKFELVNNDLKVVSAV